MEKTIKDLLTGNVSPKDVYDTIKEIDPSISVDVAIAIGNKLFEGTTWFDGEWNESACNLNEIKTIIK